MTLAPTDIQYEAQGILRARETAHAQLKALDICDWTEDNYYVVDEETRERKLIRLSLYQKAALRLMFVRQPNGHLPFRVGVFSTVKKSGKTTLAGVAARFVAETQTRMGEVYCIGNDLEQAKERAFKSAWDSIRLTPGATQKGGEWILPNRWRCQMTRLNCLSSGTRIKAISLDAAGEAGSNPDLTVWTELWGFQSKEAKRFYVEMTPVPTKPNSMRLIETYAGFEGESELLENVHKTGLRGRQLTNGELARLVSRDADGERYADFLYAFEELEGDEEAHVPIWINDAAQMCMLWDSGTAARRMPWQRGEEGRRYYEEEEHNLPANEYIRLHLNEWVSAESAFVPLASWDACLDPDIPPFGSDPDTPLILGVDAATTGDCFAVVAVSRHPDEAKHADHVWVRGCIKYDPKEEGGRIDYGKPEAFLRCAFLGGCVNGHPLTPTRDGIDLRFSERDTDGGFRCDACSSGNFTERLNVVQIAYDPYQLEDMMQRLKTDGVWTEAFPQQADRMKADRRLYDLILNRRLGHTGTADLREHVQNANAKLQKDEDSKMRIIKKVADGKIDLVVALSMAAHRCLYLRL